MVWLHEYFSIEFLLVKSIDSCNFVHEINSELTLPACDVMILGPVYDYDGPFKNNLKIAADNGN